MTLSNPVNPGPALTFGPNQTSYLSALSTGNNPILLDVSNTVTFNVTPIGAFGSIAQTYDSTYNGNWGNIFQLSSQATVANTVNTVAIYGAGVATGTGSKVWGGNFACVVANTGATGIGIEVDVNMPTAGTGYGIAIDAVGPNQAFSALQIQSNQISGGFQYGILLNNANHSAINGSLIASDPGSACQYGINFGGSFTVSEILCPSFIVGATPSSITTALQVTGGNAANSNTATIATVGSATSPILKFNAKGGTTWAPPNASAITANTFQGVANAYTGYFQANTTSGQSFGLLVSGGTTTADRALKVQNASNSSILCYIDGVGDMGLLGALGINGVAPPTQITGWGTPTGTGVISNFSGSAATLAQCSQAIATIIANLKSLGLYGA